MSIEVGEVSGEDAGEMRENEVRKSRIMDGK